jgi:alanine racemase
VLNWVELDAEAVRHNLAEFRRRIGPDVALGAVVKSNAYGHGMLEVARLAQDAGADWLCVNNAEEGVRLRQAGHDLPVLVMGYVPHDGLDEIVEHRLTPVVYDPLAIELLDRSAQARDRVVAVHLKVETGTHRQGVSTDRLPQLAARVAAAPGLELGGLSTHFANIEDTTDHRFAESQIDCFTKAVDTLRAAGHSVPIRHTACSAATVLFTRTHMDLVRVGISLYGLWPSKETYVSCLERGKPTLELKPVMTWKTRIAQIKDVPEGSWVGYGCTYRTTRLSRIAVLPVGYHEGYDRGLSGIGHVLVRGKRAPVRGRVCMNMTLVDLTDVPEASIEDEVVLLGSQGDERLPAEQLAAWCGTIAYEIVARIHPALPRRVV